MEESMDQCDTELFLSPGGRFRRLSSHPNCSANSSRVEEKAAGKAPQQQEQQITIFYNGRICICDVTEIQARAIISMANQEMDKEAKKQCDHQSQKSSFPPAQTPSATPAQPPLLNRSLSMKRSLQRFLHKRKMRSLESSPYDHDDHHLPSS